MSQASQVGVLWHLATRKHAMMFYSFLSILRSFKQQSRAMLQIYLVLHALMLTCCSK